MKYYATVNGKVFEIAVEGADRILVNGKPLQVDMQHLGRPDLFSLLIDNNSLEVVIEPNPENPNASIVFIAGKRLEVQVQDERSRRLSMVDRNMKAPAGELAVRAPIPGLVVKVPVRAGEAVLEGDVLIVLEAMKMENELCAPRGGVIHDIRVSAGDQVSSGQVMLTLK